MNISLSLINAVIAAGREQLSVQERSHQVRTKRNFLIQFINIFCKFLHWLPDHPDVHLRGLVGQRTDERLPGDAVGGLRARAGHVRHHGLSVGPR